MEKFNYHSEQVHTTYSKGHLKEKRNIVDIQDGKGIKTVIMKKNGKTRKSTHKLKKSEIKNIKEQKFMPKFFKPCYDCLRTKSKGRSRTQKKKGSLQ